MALARPLDNHGFTPLAILFVFALPIVGSLGFLIGNVPLLITAVFFAGVCLLGLQLGINAASALIYPTAYRANGSGWAFAVGRVGSVAGPALGDIRIGMKLPHSTIFLLLLLPITVGTIASSPWPGFSEPASRIAAPARRTPRPRRCLPAEDRGRERR